MLKLTDSLEQTQDLTQDIDYVKKSNDLITECLAKGFDVAEFADGTIIGTAVKIVEVKYIWDARLKKMVKTASRNSLL